MLIYLKVEPMQQHDPDVRERTTLCIFFMLFIDTEIQCNTPTFASN